ncbi:hypothetical protein AAVH_19805 [Aphelenchoides avenae]|nr:hypothetical protein AAVH_19805 [Aphelenchus avenae]
MSSIQTIPVEILLDMFHANEPADKEALQLTCHRFNSVILQNVDTLPTRLLCDIVHEHESVVVYRAPVNGGSGRDRHGTNERRESIASADQTPDEVQQMYQMFGRNVAIRELNVWCGKRPADAALTLLLEHFPSVKAAVRLDVHTFFLPTDAVLDRFTCLETIWMSTMADRDRKDPSFWSDLFATKAFRRVPNFLAMNGTEDCLHPYPHADEELFDFITDFSLMPPHKPRVVSFESFDNGGPILDALELRFNKDIASIGGEVCALFSGEVYREDRYDYETLCLSNMASGSQKETFALELFRKIAYDRE